MNKFTIVCVGTLLLATLTLASCKKIDNEEIEPKIELSDEQVFVRSAGEAAAIVLTASHDWTVSSDASWCRVAQSHGEAGTSTLEIVVDPQPDGSYDDRVCTVTFAIGAYKQLLKITQRQINALILSEKKFDLSNARHTITIELQSNMECMYRISNSWIKYIVPAAEPNALKKATLSFEIEPNLEVDVRNATILIYGTQGNGQMPSDTIYVSQIGAELYTAEEFMQEKELGYYVSKDSTIRYNPDIDQMVWNTQSHIFRIGDYLESRLFMVTMSQVPEKDQTFDIQVGTIGTTAGEVVQESFKIVVLDVSGNNAKLWNENRKRGFIVRYK